jgi:hypothetical protein
LKANILEEHVGALLATYFHTGFLLNLFWLCLPPVCTLVSCSAYSLTLKMEAMCSSEMSVDFQQATWYYIPEGSTLYANLSVNSSWSFCVCINHKGIPGCRIHEMMEDFLALGQSFFGIFFSASVECLDLPCLLFSVINFVLVKLTTHR